jgi:hypothetical protein
MIKSIVENSLDQLMLILSIYDHDQVQTHFFLLYIDIIIIKYILNN